MKRLQKLPELENFELHQTPTSALRADETPPDEGLSVGQRTFSWLGALVAAGIMLETLFFKFTAAPESVYIFQKMGTDPWWRWGQGIWELLAAVCLLTPRFKWAGGVLTLGAMSAAIISHLTWLGISIQGDHGLLFVMALMTFTGGLIVFVLHRHSIPFVTPLSSW